MRLNGIFFCFLSAAVCANAFAQTSEEEKAEPSFELKGAAVSDPAPANIDFESYQRNIDDIFHVALMTNPNLDYSINSVIVELNRKIADHPEDPRALMSLGHVYRILGQLAEANRFYQQALEKDPDNFHSNLFSAMVQADDDSFDGALKNLDAAIRIQPMDLYPWMAKGKIQMLLKRDEEARQSFQKALEIQPDNRQALFALSLIEQRLGHKAEAQVLLEKLHASKPDDLFVQYHLGALALVNKNPGEALRFWESIFHEGVRDPSFLFNLSVAYKEAGQSAKAEKILEHLRFLMPRELDVELLIADVYTQMGRFQEAESGYRGILAEQPGNLTAAVGLGELLQKQGGREAERDQILRQAAQTAQKANSLEAEKKNYEKTLQNSL